MSTFGELVYTVILESEFSTEKQNMIKASVNTDIESLNRSTDAEPRVIVPFTLEFSAPFVGHPWLTKQEMHVEYAKPEWGDHAV